MFGTPNCPECGSRFLVVRIRMAGGYVSPPEIDAYRCYRCFTKFTSGTIDEADGGDGSGTASGGTAPDAPPEESVPEAEAVAGPLSVEAVELDLSDAGAKHAVDRFAATVRNEGDGPVRVERATLAFDDGETAAAAVDPVVVPPGETASVAVVRSWIHPDQHAATLRLRADGAVVGATRIDLDRRR